MQREGERVRERQRERDRCTHKQRGQRRGDWFIFF